MVVIVPITTKVVSSNPVQGEVYSIQHYVITFFSDLQQIGGFLRFPSPIQRMGSCMYVNMYTGIWWYGRLYVC